MPKIKMDKDSFKGLFVNHVEKMVLGVVLLVFGVFVYSSLGLEGLPSSQTPDLLIKTAKSARETISNPANAKEVLASVTVPSGYIARVDDQLTPTKADFYTITKPPSPYFGPMGLKRTDPTFFPPEKVEVYPVTGAIAFAMQSPDEDQFAKEKNSTNVPKADPKKAKKKKDDNPYGMESGAEMSGMPGMAGGSAMPGMAGMPGMPGMSGMPGMAGMSGMPGMEGDPGTAGGVMANPQDRIGFVAGQGAIAKSRNAVAVKFVVPWKKQWEEYDQKFSTALGYNPSRDTPTYISFTAERIEVTGDPNEELDWSKATKIWTNRIMDNLKKEGYYGYPPEIADPRYLFYGKLTFPVPPFINRDLEPLALHSEVPKAAANNMQLTQTKEDEEKAKKKKDTKKPTDESDVPSDLPTAPNALAGDASSGMPGMPGMAGMSSMPGMAGMPGMSGGGMPGMAGMPGVASMPGMAGMPGMGEGMSGMPGMTGSAMAGMPGMEMGAMSGMDGMASGMAGMPGMTGMQMTRGPAVPYLLGRFFDFTVEPGKKYRYRVQVIVEDPNRPMMAQLEPSDRYLDDTVKKRLNQVTADEKESTSKSRIYYIRTEFSQPSEPVGIEIEPVSLAGTVTPVKTAAIPGRTQDKIVVGEPQAKVMSVIWDAMKATDVAGITTAFRGTYLNYTANVDAIHPVLLVFKSLENYPVRTDQLVADIRGGEELPMTSSGNSNEKVEPLLSIGEYALIDDSGQLIVRNELEDWDKYRRLALPELPEQPTIGMPGEGGAEADMMMPGMGMPGMGMPGMPGNTKKKGRGNRGSSSSSSM